MRIVKFLYLLPLLFSACSQESLYLPEGDVQAGEQVFEQLECFSCHAVEGEDYPAPTVITPTYVTLGSSQHSRNYLIESIITPSHQFATPKPPPGQNAGEENIKRGEESRMASYSKQITVQQLLDLVAYLEYLEKGSSQE